MPIDWIHGTRVSNWNSGAPADASKPNQSPRDSTNVRTVKASVTERCWFGSSRGRSTSASAPTSGRNVTTVSRFTI